MSTDDISDEEIILILSSENIKLERELKRSQKYGNTLKHHIRATAESNEKLRNESKQIKQRSSRIQQFVRSTKHKQIVNFVGRFIIWMN